VNESAPLYVYVVLKNEESNAGMHLPINLLKRNSTAPIQKTTKLIFLEEIV
jgi:hypothetical protein